MNINNKILELLHTTVIYECGDGYAVWLSKHTTLKDLIVLIEEFNKNNETGWGITEDTNLIVWGADQEFVTITDSKDLYEKFLNGANLQINY